MNSEIKTSLSKELFKSINQHLIYDDTPSKYLTIVFKQPEFEEYPFNLLLKLRSTEQSKLHHPEGNVWNHTLLVVDQAAMRKNKSKNATVFMWAAFLHDIGKPPTTKMRKGKITSYNHDRVGADLAKDFLSVFTDDSEFIEDVSSLIKFHMQILFVTKELSFADLKGMEQHTDIYEVALLGLCDRLGRKGSSEEAEEETIQAFIEKCENFKKGRN